ncbi:pimeloyl-ACP methyl ester carboxylesterase [Salirhabdus euzebyi]|uniref:Pimeloyl-ACP methyl ester carboxylesterase n=1 Tax=Salirhabdus euzebyi TaxID=394506 RepID=A0A841Q4A2_9BACI|nr:alpha/beta hydrolase [Salirhabdus euzebyi]MBB6453249.1 pimeloyl-ACP methyl ester carboxylesterase [Salirhabdus euzebyi]
MYKTGMAQVNGTSLYYEMVGEGKPLVLVHGFPIDSRMWDKQVEFLSKNYQVIRFDMAGLGQSASHNNDYSILEDIKALLNYLHIERATFVGFSVGGNISLELAIHYPNLVESLIVASASLPGWSNVSEEKNVFQEQLNVLYQEGDLDKIVELMCKGWVAGPFRNVSDMDPEVCDHFTSMVRNSFLKERGKGKLLMPEKKTMEFLHEINVPTLIMESEYDFPEFREMAAFMDEHISDSRVVWIPGTAHMLNLENPELFHNHLMEFLNMSKEKG